MLYAASCVTFCVICETLPPFYRGENWGLKKLSNLPQARHLGLRWDLSQVSLGSTAHVLPTLPKSSSVLSLSLSFKWSSTPWSSPGCLHHLSSLSLKPQFRTILTITRDQGMFSSPHRYCHSGYFGLSLTPWLHRHFSWSDIPPGTYTLLTVIYFEYYSGHTSHKTVERSIYDRSNILSNFTMSLLHEPLAVTDIFIFQSHELRSKGHALPTAIRR